MTQPLEYKTETFVVTGYTEFDSKLHLILLHVHSERPKLLKTHFSFLSTSSLCAFSIFFISFSFLSMFTKAACRSLKIKLCYLYGLSLLIILLILIIHVTLLIWICLKFYLHFFLSLTRSKYDPTNTAHTNYTCALFHSAIDDLEILE